MSNLHKIIAVTRECYELVKETLPPQIDKEIFARDYRGAVATAFNTARQYIQSQGKLVAESKSPCRVLLPLVYT